MHLKPLWIQKQIFWRVPFWNFSVTLILTFWCRSSASLRILAMCSCIFLFCRIRFSMEATCRSASALICVSSTLASVTWSLSRCRADSGSDCGDDRYRFCTSICFTFSDCGKKFGQIVVKWLDGYKHTLRTAMATSRAWSSPSRWLRSLSRSVLLKSIFGFRCED